MGIVRRIYDLCNERGKSIYEVCKVLGINQSTMSTWKARDADLPAKYMKKVATFLGVSIEYLVTGEETPVKRYTTEEEDEVIEMLRSLPDREKYIFIGRLQEACSGSKPSSAESEKRLFA